MGVRSFFSPSAVSCSHGCGCFLGFACASLLAAGSSLGRERRGVALRLGSGLAGAYGDLVVRLLWVWAIWLRVMLHLSFLTVLRRSISRLLTGNIGRDPVVARSVFLLFYFSHRHTCGRAGDCQGAAKLACVGILELNISFSYFQSVVDGGDLVTVEIHSRCPASRRAASRGSARGSGVGMGCAVIVGLFSVLFNGQFVISWWFFTVDELVWREVISAFAIST